MTSQISIMAEETRKSRAAAQVCEEERLAAEKVQEIARLTIEFEAGFKEQLPLLKEAGIEYQVHIKETPVKQGYVKFKLGENELGMDFNSRNSYRYEFLPVSKEGKHGKTQFGDWSKVDFILWIDDNLIRK